MKQAKILLLDLNRSDDLAFKLQGILGSSLSPKIQFRRECGGVYGSGFLDDNISKIISGFGPDLILLLLSPGLLKQPGILIQSIRRETSELPILAVIEECEPDRMVELLKLGANDFITPPLRSADVLPRLWRLLEKTAQGETLTQRIKEKLGLKQLVGESPRFLAEIKKVSLLAKCDVGVLISGETGTGKELFARAIHYLSQRAGKPFIPVNCGAIPVELVENELFGHERGAFTGASMSQPGLIREADSGTLFLDEIDCIPLLAQVKLLRFIEEKEYRALGSIKMRRADVRIIAATNIDLEAAVKEGNFRRDLYYRLNIISIKLPPLRERREDIPLLANHFLSKYAGYFKGEVKSFSPNALQKLMPYEWPGNVRELEHAVECAVLFSEQAVIQSADISLPDSEPDAGEESFQSVKERVIAQFEKNYLQNLLRTYGGNITKAAQAAQKNRRAFWQLMRKHGIDAQGFKSGGL